MTEDLEVKVNSIYCSYFMQRNLIKMKCTLLSWMFLPLLVLGCFEYLCVCVCVCVFWGYCMLHRLCI